MCEYCAPSEYGKCADIIGEKFIDATDRFWLSVASGKFRIERYGYESAPINYCPMCGRLLKDEKYIMVKEEK